MNDRIVSPSVLAVVVTYNPAADLGANLRALRSQIDAVVVVDNASHNRNDVARIAEHTGCDFIQNSENLGVAEALNQGVRKALDGGFEWLATFDQDSLLQPGSITGLLDLYSALPERERVAVLAHSHRDTRTGKGYHIPGDILEDGGDWRSLRVTITSGSLIRTEVFDVVGLFDERLFIDGVDLEFCVRCRRRGYRVVESVHHQLQHSLGEGLEARILGKAVVVANYPSIRRYYIVRNNLELFRRFAIGGFPEAFRRLYATAIACLVGLVAESGKLEKSLAMLAGARDFALRRFGRKAR